MHNAPATHPQLVALAWILAALTAYAVIGFALLTAARRVDRRDLANKMRALAHRWDEGSVELLTLTAPEWKRRGELRVAHITKGRGHQLDDCARELLEALEEK